MAIHQLIDLDFTPGVRAEYINKNFDLVYNWIRRERLRVGGWGLVEGFQLSCDANNFTVSVSEGIMINSDGDEVEVPAWTFGAGEVPYRQVTKKYRVDSEGKVSLDDYPYDRLNKRYITYNPPGTVQDFDDNTLYVFDEDGFYIPVVRVIGKDLWVNATNYKNTTISVCQLVASDRIDTIMLHKDGEYEYLWSIDSTSPSHVDLADYDDTFCIGVVYWTVTTTGIGCEFFINHRSYRKVYVDKTNTLYLNGEVYKKPKYIYFEEPEEEDREINDLWYNVKDNTLYIWRYHDGELGWVIVNDHSEIIVKERKVWYPEDNPSDLKTFRFDDEDINLRFVPGTNALDILIDNAPLMDDQYDETSVNEQEVSDMVSKIDEYKEKLAKEEENLKGLNQTRKNIEGAIQVIRKDLADSKALYPELYNEDNVNYDIQREDLPNLRNLMVLNQRIAEELEKVESLMVDINRSQNLIDNYKEQIEIMSSITDGTYVSTGNGFKLKRPLSKASYVEVTVTHVVRMKPARETFQRAAIFVKEGDITVTSGSNELFETSAVYSVGDDQLEVFVDGVRLSKGLNEFVEVVDSLTKEQKEKLGTDTVDYIYSNSDHRDSYYQESSSHFRVKKYLSAGQTVSYRISKHVWSYDQLDKLISNIKTYALQAYEQAIQAFEEVQNINVYVHEEIESFQTEIGNIKEQVKKIDSCYKRGETIDWKDMPKDVKDNMVGTLINISKTAVTPNLVIDGVRTEKDAMTGEITGGDIFQVYYISPDMNRVLVREGQYVSADIVDYWVESAGENKIEITLRDDLVSSDAYIYVTGFKRGHNEEESTNGES